MKRKALLLGVVAVSVLGYMAQSAEAHRIIVHFDSGLGNSKVVVAEINPAVLRGVKEIFCQAGGPEKGDLYVVIFDGAKSNKHDGTSHNPFHVIYFKRSKPWFNDVHLNGDIPLPSGQNLAAKVRTAIAGPVPFSIEVTTFVYEGSASKYLKDIAERLGRSIEKMRCDAK